MTKPKRLNGAPSALVGKVRRPRPARTSEYALAVSDCRTVGSIYHQRGGFAASALWMVLSAPAQLGLWVACAVRRPPKTVGEQSFSRLDGAVWVQYATSNRTKAGLFQGTYPRVGYVDHSVFSSRFASRQALNGCDPEIFALREGESE